MTRSICYRNGYNETVSVIATCGCDEGLQLTECLMVEVDFPGIEVGGRECLLHQREGFLVEAYQLADIAVISRG